MFPLYRVQAGSGALISPPAQLWFLPVCRAVQDKNVGSRVRARQKISRNLRTRHVSESCRAQSGAQHPAQGHLEGHTLSFGDGVGPERAGDHFVADAPRGRALVAHTIGPVRYFVDGKCAVKLDAADGHLALHTASLIWDNLMDLYAGEGGGASGAR